VGSGGHLGFAGSEVVGGTLSILYSYHLEAVTESAPEPTTMLLFSSAMLGLGAMVIRRRNRA
jgi:hypothetical protein